MAKPKNDLKRMTVRISAKKINDLMKFEPQQSTASDLMRHLVDKQLEQHRSAQAHRSIIGKLGPKDFDDHLF